MAAGLFEGFSTQFLTPFNQVSSIAESLTTMIIPLIVAGLTIKIMWFGFETIRGQGGQNPWLEMFFRNVRPALVVGLCLTGGAYATNVVGTIEDLRTSLTALFSHTDATNSYAALDQSMDKAMQLFFNMMNDAIENHIHIGLQESDLTGIVMIISAFIMVLALMFYALVAAAQLMVIDVMLKVILAFGPIFIGCFAFSSLSRFFDAWLSTVLKYTITAVLIMAVIGIANGILDNYAASILANADTLGSIKIGFNSLCASGLLVYFTLKVPALAGEMLGSVGISIFSPSSLASPAGQAMQSVGGAAGKAATGAANYAGSHTSAAASSLRSMVARATRSSSGGGTISAGDNSSRHSAADWTKAIAARNAMSSNSRPTTPTMQSMIGNN